MAGWGALTCSMSDSKQEMVTKHVEVAKALLYLVEKSIAIHKDRVEHGTPMKPHEMSRMTEVASRLERLSRGEATDRIEGRPDLSKLTDEQLAQYEELSKIMRGE